uniref:Uncharacterized protein n=1 Tax=Oryza rufipogon TaxID=4529 RepID=A0A0E0NHT0_ORYRU
MNGSDLLNRCSHINPSVAPPFPSRDLAADAPSCCATSVPPGAPAPPSLLPSRCAASAAPPPLHAVLPSFLLCTSSFPSFRVSESWWNQYDLMVFVLHPRPCLGMDLGLAAAARPCAALVYCSFVIIVQSTISDQGVIFGEYVSEFSCSNGTFLQPPLCASVWRTKH